MTTGRIEAVCVVHADRPDAGRVGTTAIDKRPVPGAVHIGPLGLAGDHVCDTEHHGGLDQAVYVYDGADADHWERELNRPLPAGWFGENLRLRDTTPSDAVIGERWRIGTTGPLLEVTIPRTPCATFGRWSAEPLWVRRFAAHGAVGAYLRVLEEGPVTAGDPVTVMSVPDHGVTIRSLFTGTARIEQLEMLLAGPDPAPKVARDAGRLLTRLRARV
ncbi:MOSC domain-containing protein [Rhodococcus sp. D2-41]|uniref:MOSC domain-containing protein n=1 Tax=Speluncibacter jeojiensis TaxID=2710754 RepID=A0A9X4RDP1_9ACTN|nr:MOSC domain-containing protein [Rhodococcus sp. D2-41]MDG3011593.1 MOSC domain-containing protein [Rhodococcus sp. D2-41]MDG3015050.1 MOSC domain-containing protein [Corynebacteriales bacterium D3-21]